VRLLPPLLALVLTAAACGPLPRPFQEEDKQALDLQAPSTRAPLRVFAPEGVPPGDPDRFALLLAERLLELGVAAEPHWFTPAVSAPLETRRLLGHAALEAGAEGAERLAVAWRLREPDGRETPLVEAEAALSPEGWAAGETDSLEAAAQVSAATIARALGLAPPISEEPLADAARRRLVVLPIEGAPGDGAESLERSITRALREQRVALAGLPQEHDLLLWCRVEVDPPRGAHQAVRIRWRVELASDFSELGTITQENLVPAGSLDRAWRETAPLIAQAAAGGIVELLRQAEIGPGPLP